MKKFIPSQFQKDIFNFIKNETGSLVIEAVAGSGKTSTCIEALNLLDEEKSVVFLAFNKSIATELSERAPSFVDCMTTHSLGYKAIRKDLPRVKVDSDKMTDIVLKMHKQNMMTQADYIYSSSHVKKLVSLAKANGLGPGKDALLEDTLDNWNYLLEYYGIDFGSPNMSDSMATRKTLDIIGWARTALERSNEMTTIIDFDDQLYLPIIHGLKFPKYELVFVDEAQDMSPIQRAVLDRVMGKNSRLIAVGDRKQVLYMFRGASIDSLEQIEKKFNCKTLPLSTSYRCGKNIIKEAQKFVPQIQHYDGAADGLVETRDVVWAKEIEPGDYVICRYKAPLVKMAYKLLRNKIPSFIMGRDMAAGIISTINKMKAKDMDSLIEKLAVWRDKEIQAKLKKDPAADISVVDDKFECINAFIDAVHPETPEDLMEEIDKMFTEKKKAVLFSTVHKIKGKEANRVWFADRMSLPPKFVKKPNEIQIENNLIYVGITRAKRHLIYFNSGSIVDGDRKPDPACLASGQTEVWD